MTKDEIRKAQALLAVTIFENPFIPANRDPTEKQALFLALDCPEALYGGAAGGGKTDAALMAGAQFLPVPGYHAILIRRTYPQLRQQGGLIERALAWWGAENWNEQRHEFTFPHPDGPPSVLGFGSLENENAKYKYDGAEFDFVGIDEVRHFTQAQYTYLLTRIRGTIDVPRRLRAFTNPGALWIRERFGIQRPSPANGQGRAMQLGPEGRRFVPAFLDENPHLLASDQLYIEKLMAQDPVTRAQMLNGDWWIQAGGNMFKIAGQDGTPPGCGYIVLPASKLPPIDSYAAVMRIVDLAATEPSFANPDPDWMRAQLWALTSDGFYHCIDQESARIGPGHVEAWLEDLVKRDIRRHPQTGWVLEREAGSEAKMWVEGIVRRFTSRGLIPHSQIFIDRPTTDKVTRARDYAAAVSRGLVAVVHADWTEDFLDEHRVFPAHDRHDDQVDPGSVAVGSWLQFYANRLKAERAAMSGERPEFERPD